ncbi:YxlC family protein [Cohnella candidum]|uniref:YxlC family protein n=1 Tax=Cohnella candidum TaxID=2674991 RepID=A0A3G3JSS7_9BACL|nr:YxlC family protein [Cohnella candidum]AYQ71280.1 hypothetical protein EAV92_00855 [Cohnella candidum]
MTKPSDDRHQEERLLKALNETWAQLDAAFEAEPAPLADWTALVKQSKRQAKRKLWRELAILWTAALGILGLMILLMTGMQNLFWLFQAAATVAAVPLLISEVKRAARMGGGGSAS